MNRIVSNYFSDRPTSGDCNEKKYFFSPADLYEINEVEKSLLIKFPKDYIDFLCISSGYDGKIGQLWGRIFPLDYFYWYGRR